MEVSPPATPTLLALCPGFRLPSASQSPRAEGPLSCPWGRREATPGPQAVVHPCVRKIFCEAAPEAGSPLCLRTFAKEGWRLAFKSGLAFLQEL